MGAVAGAGLSPRRLPAPAFGRHAKPRRSWRAPWCSEPDVLLMDEPFAALDIGLKAQLHRLLLRHQRAKGTAC